MKNPFNGTAASQIGARPYNIVTNDDANSAEINLYGDVVERHPRSWWNNEPIPGNFIAVDDFLKDLDELATRDKITVYINSGGGDMYSGIAIHNKLKGLRAEVTTVCDGLAASAASMIFMAGSTRKMHAGSNLMIHSAACFLYGYCQMPDLQDEIKRLRAHNKAAVKLYVQDTGLDEDKVQELYDAETWMTGQDAVDEGFATEVIDAETDKDPVKLQLSPDKQIMMCNGRTVAASFHTTPINAVQLTADEWAKISNPAAIEPPKNSADPIVDSTNHSTGGKKMEIKNAEDLRKAHPDLVTEIENAARTAGVTAERNRIQGIESIQAAIGDAKMIKDAKYGEKPMDAQQLAFAAMQAQAAIGATVVQDMATDTQTSGAGEVAATPAGSGEKTDDQKAIDTLLTAVKNQEGK